MTNEQCKRLNIWAKCKPGENIAINEPVWFDKRGYVSCSGVGLSQGIVVGSDRDRRLVRLTRRESEYLKEALWPKGRL